MVFGIWGCIILGSILGSMLINSPILLALPVACLLIFLLIVDFKKVFLMLIACLPLSTEISVIGGVSTDLPTEPLMVVLMLVYFVYALSRPKQLGSSFLVHPISLLLMVHVGWILVTTITSSLLFVSVKYLLAKIWYVTVFYFLAGLLIRNEKDLKQLFWYFFIPLMLTVLIIMVRHASFGFTFRDIYQVLHPFYRNHVSYAGIMTLFFPIIWLAMGWYRRFSLPWWFVAAAIPVLFAAIYLSYTRAAYVALLVAAGAYFVVRLRMMRLALAAAVIASILTVVFFVRQNTYLEYAPNFDRTITHVEFDNLIEATYKLEDISTVERFYRWIAGCYMFTEKPVFGFGPGNFTKFYRSYTVTSFRTYVSRNEDQSGIHSYYLMLLVEQGLVGLLLFIALTFYFLIRGERIYHRTHSPGKKRIVMMLLLCVIVISSFSIINDVVETDKFGPWFFMSLAILVNMDARD